MTQQQIQSNLRKYWWLFPLLGFIVWGVVYYWASSKVKDVMASVRASKETKASDDILNDQAADVKANSIENT